MKTPRQLTAEIVADIKHAMEMYDEDEVAFIVRAVIAHDGLVTALKAAQRVIGASTSMADLARRIDVALAKADGRP